MSSSTPAKYKTGDYVLIKNEYDSKPTIGKIEEILPSQNPNETTIRYNLYIPPEDTVDGRQEHNSRNELYKTSEIEKEFYSNIIAKCEIISYENYLKKIMMKQKVKDVYFYRQKYSKEDDAYIPDIDPSCYCNKIFNPDSEFSQCVKCKEFFHIKCYTESKNKKCPNESCNNNLSLQLNAGKPKEEKKLIGNKRDRADLESNNNNKSQNDDRYRNLPEKNRNNLINYIEKIEKMNNMLSKTLNETQKARQNAHDKLLYSLLYGIEELRIKSNEFWEKKAKNNQKLKNEKVLQINPVQLTKENVINEDFINGYCNNLSIEIEYYIYLANKEIVSSSYKKKLLMLYTNLIDERNTELRCSILLNEILPSKLVEMSSEELAPSSVKKKRIEQQNKYFKEQVLMEEDAKIIAKTHKGDGLLSVEPKDKNSEGFIPFEVLEQHKTIRDNKKENEQAQQQSQSQIETNNNGDDNNKDIKKKNIFNGKKEDIKKHNKVIELKFKNLSSEKLKFYFELDEFKRENILGKINEKIKSNLKAETAEEIKKMREVLQKQS